MQFLWQWLKQGSFQMQDNFAESTFVLDSVLLISKSYAGKVNL